MRYRIKGRHKGAAVNTEVEAPSRFAAYHTVANAIDTVLWVGPANLLGYIQERLAFGPGPMQISVWTRQMATMLDAGLAVRKALEISGQSDSPQLNLVLWAVQRDVSAGKPLSVAMARHAIFPPEFAQMMRAGEKTGRMTQVLRRLADDAERAAHTRQLLLSSLTYPVCVTAFGVVLTIWFLYEVMPALTAIFNSLHAQLPLVTRMLIGCSQLISSPSRLALAALLMGLAAYAVQRILRHFPTWRLVLLEGVKRIPVLGPLLKAQDDSRLLATFSSMLCSGVHLNQALPILREITPFPTTRKGLDEVAKAVREGVDLSVACSRYGLFSKAVNHMLTVGEESGTLEGVMDWSSRLLDLEVEHRVADLIAMSEPLTMVILGGLAMFFVLGAFLPLISLMQALM